MKKILLFLSFLLMSIGVWGATASVQISTYATSHGWADATKYTSINVDANVTATVSGGVNTGKYYVNGNNWRLYQSENATITISTSSGVLQSVAFTYTSEKNGVLTDGNTNINSGYEITLNSNTKTFSIGNTSSATNGQVRITEIVVVYENETPCDSIPISLYQAENGSAKLNKNKIYPGEEVEITNITPAPGYMLDTIIGVNSTYSATVGNVDMENHKITNITEECVVLVLFKPLPPEPEIEIVEWNPDYIKVDIDNFDAVTAVIENKNTQEVHENNVADSLFFSKYFEAASNVKLLGVYNGTNHTIDISSYGISIADCGKEKLPGDFETTLFSEIVYRDINDYDNTLSLTTEEMMLEPNEEIILISYQKNNAADSAIIKCAQENSKSGFSKYYRLKTPTLQFNGDDAIALVNPDGDFIDLIGAGTKDGGSVVSAVNRTTTNTGAYNGFMDNPGGWYSADGINIETNDSSYALSTNRCLLIRKNSVKSGLNAVNKNTIDFVTLGGIYGEWRGLQIPGISHNDGSGDGTLNSCNGFEDIGDYDYGNYYAQYNQVGEDITLASKLQPDGTYKISIPDLDTLSCTLLKVIVSDNSNKSEECEYKIPIFVTENTVSNSILFSQEGDDCPECDVVIINGGKLTVNSNLENRDVTVYPGGVLVIPEGQTYNVNSLTLRRENNEVPYFSYKGNLVLTDKFYIDLRTDADDWRWMTLPFSHKVSDIKLSNGKPINLNNDVWVSYYDGKYRSINQRNAWKDVMRDTTFNAGEGFLFGADLPGHSKKTYRFSFHKDTVENEKQNKVIKNLFAWGGENENLAPNHKGWNLIGNPFMDNDTTDIIDPIRIGVLKKDSVNGQWTGGWVVDSVTTKLRYAVVPNKDEQFADAGYYESVVLDNYVLKPLTSFFVQLGGNEEDMQTLTFKPEKRVNRIVARNYQMQEDDETFLRIKVDNWKTGCFISNKFTEDYEPGDDLESRYKIYQSIGGYKLLYSAINDSIIENGIKVASPNGNLHLDEKTNIDEFEYIYVLYDDNWYDLLHGETVDVENSNFILQAKRKRCGITTDINHIPAKGLYKYTDGVNIYINKNGTIFDIVGSRIK